jgi:hypothetical protein
LTFHDLRHLWLNFPTPLGSSGDKACDAQLSWSQVHGANHSIFIAIGSSMYHTLESSPNNDIASSDNLTTGIYISDDDYMA